MVNKEKLIGMIINTELEKIPGPEDVWEKHVYLNGKVLIVGYKESGKFCEQTPEDEYECVISYSWYWELRDAETWNILQENHDTDLSFYSESQKKPWSDEEIFENIGSIPGNEISTWGEQSYIEDIAEDIADEVIDWLKS